MISRTPSLHELASAPYVSLRTFRAAGSSVQVPIWTLAHGDRLWIRSSANTFKVKRLRNDPRAQVALCNGSGKTILSDFVPAHARLLEDDASLAEARALTDRKYGWQSSAIGFVYKYLRGNPKFVVIELALD